MIGNHMPPNTYSLNEWMDALVHVPPEESLLLAIEDLDSPDSSVELVMGFYAEGEYNTGSSSSGDPLPDDKRVRFWMIPTWPDGYDANGLYEIESSGYQKFCLGGCFYHARSCVDGVLIDPRLPSGFDNTANESRPSSHQKWWFRPFINTETVQEMDELCARRSDEYAEAGRKQWQEARQEWLQSWPSGTRYDVRCLDGGAWDRSTNWGSFATLEEALHCVLTGPAWRNAPARAARA